MSDLHIEYVDADKLRTHPENARQGDIGAISESIRVNGVYRPIIAQASTGYILAGNHTFQALQATGHTQVPAILLDIDDTHAARIMLADNRTADLGDYDIQQLINNLTNLDTLEGTGYDPDDLDDLQHLLDPPNLDAYLDGDEENVPETPETPATRPGDIWQLGPHRVICGDSTNPQTWQALMGDTLADCIWTDPPYGVQYTGPKRHKQRAPIKDDTPHALPHLLTTALTHATTHTRPGAPVYIALAAMNWQAFTTACQNARIDVRQQLVWVKDEPILSWADYQWQHEPIIYGFTHGGTGRLGRGSDNWHGTNKTSTVFQVPKPPAAREHPTMKPVNLIAPMLTNSTPTDAVILDPFAGSGSTLLAAHQTGRAARLIEIEPGYVDVIAYRWQKETGEKPVNVTTGKTHDFTHHTPHDR